MKEGYYYLKTKDGIQEPVLVHGYFFEGKFVFGFNIYDGGGLLPIDDLTENTIVVPVTIVESQDKEGGGNADADQT